MTTTRRQLVLKPRRTGEEEKRRAAEVIAKRQEEQRLEKQREENQRLAVKRKEEADWKRISDYLDSLSKSARQQVIDEAIDSPRNDFIRARLRKYQKANDANADIYLEMALRNHVLPLLEMSNNN